MTLRQLFPADQADPDLTALYAYPDGPWLRANMVSSVDGAASLKGIGSAVRRRIPGIHPTVEMAVRRCATPSWGRYLDASSTESRFNSGSPIPMKTA